MTAENNPPAQGESEDDVKSRKRKERLEQNRISARESRKRKKSMIEELQRTVITLSRENKELNERNEALRRQLMEIATKYPNVVPMQAIMGTAPPAAPMAAAVPPGQVPQVAAPPATGDAAQQSQPPAAPAAFPAAGMFFMPQLQQPGAVPQQPDATQLAAQAAQMQAQQAAQQAAAPPAPEATEKV